MLKVWKKSFLISVGVAILAYEGLKKAADQRLKEARQARQAVRRTA